MFRNFFCCCKMWSPAACRKARRIDDPVDRFQVRNFAIEQHVHPTILHTIPRISLIPHRYLTVFPLFVASSIFWVSSLPSLRFIFSVSVARLHSWRKLSKRKHPPCVDGQSNCSTANSLFCGLFEVIRLLTSLISPIPQFKLQRKCSIVVVRIPWIHD